MIRGTRTAERYVENIIHSIVLASLSRHPRLTFQEDNARAHILNSFTDFHSAFLNTFLAIKVARSLCKRAHLGSYEQVPQTITEFYQFNSIIGNSLTRYLVEVHTPTLYVIL